MPSAEKLQFILRPYSPAAAEGMVHRLASNEVHLWYSSAVETRFDAQLFAQLLSADERDRMERFRFGIHRNNFLFCRGMLRILLASYLGISPAELRFAYSAHGKPTLADSSIELNFNLSHCNEKLLIGICLGSKIGVDIEKIRRDLDVREIASRFFSQTERKDIESFPGDTQHNAFFACWTRKEAYVKAQGEGLSRALDSFDVSVDPDEERVSLTTRPDTSEACGWELLSLKGLPGFSAAVAVSRKSVSV